jgi:hypothetical protein
MQFRRLTDAGLQAFQHYLNELRADPAAQPPAGLLADAAASEPLSPPIAAVPVAFPNRMAFARWLHDAADAAGRPVPHTDAGFWAWLSLALFDQVCPPDGHGRRKVKEDARYLPAMDRARRYYRHALLGPYLVFARYQDNPERTATLLSGTLSKLTDEAYRLFVENQLVAYSGAVAVLNDFYFDHDRGRIKRGAQTKKPGSIRRFVKLLSQYARTFDLDVLPEQQLESMLPPEFNRWRDARTLFSPAATGSQRA